MTATADRTDERDALREVARRVLEKESSSARVRAVMETPAGYDPAVWRTMGELGWTGLEIPEAYGGAGSGFPEVAVVLEELGRHVTASPFFSTVVLGAGLLLAAGDEPHRRELLPRIVAAELKTAVVAPFMAGEQFPVVHETDRRYTIEGRAPFVLDGAGADLLLLVASSDGSDGASILAVPASAEGVRRRDLPTMDMTRRLCDISFEGVHLPADALVGHVGDARALSTWLVDRASTGIALDSVGGAERVLEMCVDYAKVRVQFGRPIGTFQAIKHRCADMLILVEASRVAAEDAAEHSLAEIDEPSTAPAIAKAYACDAFAKVAGDGIQLHGGIGYTWDHDIQLFFKRAKLNQALFGHPSWHRGRLADMLLPRARTEGTVDTRAPGLPVPQPPVPHSIQDTI
jgi:alkylation response protein AidB-like acyl-CoA dehydrogenase